MPRSARSGATSDGEAAALLERLCALDRDVVFFPVRHHSPAAADLVRRWIQDVRPRAVLVEGPADFNDRMNELLLDHDLPIAIYSYFRTSATDTKTEPGDIEGRPDTAEPEVHRGAYYPFCEYSPEWAALRAAKEIGAVTQFIDLPYRDVAHLDRATHRYADAELRRGRYVQTLCDRLHVEGFDELWDVLVESHEALTLTDYLQRAHSLCLHVRLWEGEPAVSAADRWREKFMAENVAALRRQFESGELSTELPGPILVVTGGFHSSALAVRLDNVRCSGLGTTDPSSRGDAPLIAEAGIALTTYSYERLDNLTGYDAGMPNPGFYDLAWRQRRDERGFDHRPMLTALVQELRERKQRLSTADLIAVETAALGLAALRGRAHVWRQDLVDAVTSALIKDEMEYGCRSPFLEAVHAVLRGHRRGRLAAGTRMPPLVLDVRHQLKEANLELQAHRNVELDLLQPSDLPKSRLLHRLRVLEIHGFQRTGGTDFVSRDDLSRLWETWSVRWSPEFEASCIEASRYGTSLPEAVAARLAQQARGLQRDAAGAAALLLQAAQAGMETLSTELVERLEELIQEEAQFTAAVQALGHLLHLYCHDEAFGATRTPRIGRLLASAFQRSLWLLEALGQSSGNDAMLLQGMRALSEAYQRAELILELSPDEFPAVLDRVSRDSHKPATVRGAAAGILWTLEVADEEQILSDLMTFASPTKLGDYLAGLFALAREVVQRHSRLVSAIDRLLLGFTADDFLASLPSLRLAFTFFTPREKHHLLTTLFASLGLKTMKPLAPLTVDPQAAAEALAFEERLLEMVERYGLKDPADS